MYIKKSYYLIIATIACSITNTTYAKDNFSVQDIFAYTRFSEVAAAPDAKQLAYVTFKMVSAKEGKKWQYSLHVRNGQNEHNLTTDNEISNLIWSNDNKWLGYISKGKEAASIWIEHADGSEHHKLMELNKDITSFSWAPNNHAIAFTAGDHPKDKTPAILTMMDVNKDFINSRLYIADFTNGKMSSPIALTENTISLSQFMDRPGFCWSPDSRAIAFSFQERAGAAYGFANKIGMINLSTHKMSVIPYTMEHTSSQPVYSLDGKHIAFQAGPSNLMPDSANEKKFYMAKQALLVNICGYSLSDGKVTCLANTPNQAPILLGWNKENTGVYVSDVDKTNGFRIYRLGFNKSNSVQLIGPTDGNMSPTSINMNASFTQIIFTLDTVQKAPEVYTLNVSNNSFIKQTHDNEKLSQALGNANVIHWTSKDGKQIEGLLITPPDYNAKKKYPLLVDLHGGPSGVWTKHYLGGCEEYGNSFVTTTCYANELSQGYIIFQPNPRGSSGYGADFRLAPVGDIGGSDYADVSSGVDYLIKNNIADPNHLAINGWSYGGFMTAWTIGHDTRFKAAVEADGNTDFVSFTGTSDIPMFPAEYLGTQLWDNPSFYLERSPITYTKNIVTPLLIISGGNDIRVPITQGQELYTSLKYQHKSVKMIVLPNQDHVPNDANLIYESIEAISDWLKQALI